MPARKPTIDQNFNCSVTAARADAARGSSEYRLRFAETMSSTLSKAAAFFSAASVFTNRNDKHTNTIYGEDQNNADREGFKCLTSNITAKNVK